MVEYLFRDSPPHPINVVDAKDSYLVTKEGKSLLDFMMGWCVGNAGWNKRQILRQVKNFKGPVYVPPTYEYSRWNVLAEKLALLMPGKKGCCFRATGGTEAVELALKIARAYNHREKFIAFRDAYHGQSFACMGLVGLHKDKFGPFPDYYVQVDAKDWDSTTNLVVEKIRKGDVCAFISEPIVCNLGVIVPPKSFFDGVRDACRETNTLLIMDEVATGFGRTGKWFGFEHFGLEPDIVTIAKGFSSGYAAIGAAIAKPAVAEAMRFDFSNYSTFGWHPVSTECAIANIDYIQQKNLISKSEKSGNYLVKRLSEFCKPEGRGLCVGFECQNQNVERDCYSDGLCLSSLNGRVVLFPALDVKRSEIDAAVEILRRHLQ